MTWDRNTGVLHGLESLDMTRVYIAANQRTCQYVKTHQAEDLIYVDLGFLCMGGGGYLFVSSLFCGVGGVRGGAR